MDLNRPRLLVDVNEIVDLDHDVVLISREDQKVDSAGNVVTLEEGMRVYLYTPDADDRGAPTYLVATGLTELNRANDWSASVKWCCRIDQSDVINRAATP